MTDHDLLTRQESESVATVEGNAGDALNGDRQQTAQRPYLKVFGPDIGVFEFTLTGGVVSIGRAEQSDIRFADPRVSRSHCAIKHDHGDYVLEDLGSSQGTTVNRNRIQTHRLRHGDSIQIGAYVLQFRTHHTIPGAAAAAEKAKLLLRSQFSVLPSTMRLKYRTLATAPQEIFSSGDTLRIGQSGLLIPVSTPPDDQACLELRLSWSEERVKQFLGEIVGVIEEEAVHWMCVKLHTVSREVFQTTVDSGQPGPWVDVAST